MRKLLAIFSSLTLVSVGSSNVISCTQKQQVSQTDSLNEQINNLIKQSDLLNSELNNEERKENQSQEIINNLNSEREATEKEISQLQKEISDLNGPRMDRNAYYDGFDTFYITGVSNVTNDMLSSLIITKTPANGSPITLKQGVDYNAPVLSVDNNQIKIQFIVQKNTSQVIDVLQNVMYKFNFKNINIECTLQIGDFGSIINNRVLITKEDVQNIYKFNVDVDGIPGFVMKRGWVKIIYPDKYNTTRLIQMDTTSFTSSNINGFSFMASLENTNEELSNIKIVVNGKFLFSSLPSPTPEIKNINGQYNFDFSLNNKATLEVNQSDISDDLTKYDYRSDAVNVAPLKIKINQKNFIKTTDNNKPVYQLSFEKPIPSNGSNNKYIIYLMDGSKVKYSISFTVPANKHAFFTDDVDISTQATSSAETITFDFHNIFTQDYQPLFLTYTYIYGVPDGEAPTSQNGQQLNNGGLFFNSTTVKLYDPTSGELLIIVSLKPQVVITYSYIQFFYSMQSSPTVPTNGTMSVIQRMTWDVYHINH